MLRGWYLHGVGEFLWSLGLLGEHRMRRLSDGDAAERFTDCVAQLFGRRLLRGGQHRTKYLSPCVLRVGRVETFFKAASEVLSITRPTVCLLCQKRGSAVVCACSVSACVCDFSCRFGGCTTVKTAMQRVPLFCAHVTWTTEDSRMIAEFVV